MPLPPRPSGSFASPSVRGSASATSVPVYELVKARVLIRLGDRLDPAKARRMPFALFQETARQLVEQAVEAEGPRLSRPDRERLVEDVLVEAMGFGPLEELFRDATVLEVLVLGPHAVVVRRESGWVPTNVKLRDETQLRAILEKAADQNEAVGGGLSPTALDVKLGNGFRAVAVLPPTLVGSPATAVFVRVPEVVGTPVAPSPSASGAMPRPPLSGVAATPAPRPGGSGRVAPPTPRSAATDSPAAGESPFSRYKGKVTQRMIERLARMGVYDLSSVEVGELRRLVAASVTDFCAAEKVYLSDSEQGRLTLEILTGMHR